MEYMYFVSPLLLVQIKLFSKKTRIFLIKLLIRCLIVFEIRSLYILFMVIVLVIKVLYELHRSRGQHLSQPPGPLHHPRHNGPRQHACMFIYLSTYPSIPILIYVCIYLYQPIYINSTIYLSIYL